MYAKPCCLSLVSAAHLCPLHHVPPLSGCGVLAVYIWPQHDWWLESGADSGSSPLSARSLPTHVRAPSASFLRHSCQVSQNNDYLSPETNLHSDTFPGWCLVAWGLLCRGPLPTSQSSCETSFLRVCKTCQEANIEVWERERSLYSLFLWSLLTNNYSYARCPGCTANVPTFLHGRTAELKAWGKKKNKKNRVRLLHFQSGQLQSQKTWVCLEVTAAALKELQVRCVCNTSAEGTPSCQTLLTSKSVPLMVNNHFQWSKMFI